MLNPFIQLGPKEEGNQKNAAAEEFSVQMYGHSLDTSTPRPSMGLWVGRLLIRMGQKLTKQDAQLKSIRENA